MQRLGDKHRRLARTGVWLALCCVLGGVPGVAQAFLRPAPGVEPATPHADHPQFTAPKAVEPTPDPHEQNPLYDRTNPDFERLQAPREALLGLPRDPDDKVDWMKALRERSIVPRASLDGTRTNFALDLDVVMRNTKAMPYVLFPHRPHTEWLDCANCHPAPFEARSGSTQIKMEDIFRGRYCGACHDRVAFVTHRNCFRCHSQAQPGSPVRPQ